MERRRIVDAIGRNLTTWPRALQGQNDPALLRGRHPGEDGGLLGDVPPGPDVVARQILTADNLRRVESDLRHT